MNLISHFPYAVPREIQRRTLEELGNNWDKYDVFVISAPTAFGKTGLAKTLMNAFHSVSVITPTNLLVDQFLQEFPETPTLKRMDSYRCDEWKRPCSVTRAKLGRFCKGCPCGKALATAKYKSGPGIYNYHVYLSQKLKRDVLVVDEAHNLMHHIRERQAIRIWQHDIKYPGNMFSYEQMAGFLQKLGKEKVRKSKKLSLWQAAVTSLKPEHTVQRTKASFNGKGTVRGEPEDRDCIELLPVDITQAPPMFWGGVRKLVLLSATINHKDIETLGLHRKRVLYINCESPIAAHARPIVIDPLSPVNRKNQEEATVKIANYIHEVLAPQHVGEKGLIHATYSQARILSGILTGPRYIFHDKWNKKDQYEFFRNSPAKDGRILIACGMYEGIDLPEDLGRWQVIAKIPWPSLGNPAIKYQAEKDEDWYSWETWRIVIQACGRICRTPDDFGVTYCLDSSILRLIRQGEHLLPRWFVEGMIAGDEYLKGEMVWPEKNSTQENQTSLLSHMLPWLKKLKASC